MGCINKNTLEYKRLVAAFGDKLAEAFVRGYSKNVKGLSDDFYFPSVKEVTEWLTKDKKEIPNHITRALELDPLMSTDAIKRLLKGVIHDYKGTTFLTSGPFNIHTITQEVRDAIYLPNFNVMRELENRHPSIFRMGYTKSPYRKIVEITPLSEGQQGMLFKKPGSTATAEASPKTISMIKDFIRSIGVDIKTLQKVKVNGVEYDAEGVAIIMQKIIQVVEGKEATSLPEEAMHFVVEIIKQKNPQLYRKLFNSIGSYEMTQMVFNDYANDPEYQTKDGKPDVIKLKEEEGLENKSGDLEEAGCKCGV